MRLFNIIESITSKDFDITEMEFDKILLIEILPELFSHMKDSGLNSIYMDENSYITKDSDGKVTLFYLKSIKLLDEKWRYRGREVLYDCFVNYFHLRAYKSIYEKENYDEGIIVFGLEIYETVEIQDKENYSNNWHILSWLMEKWKEYTNEKVPVSDNCDFCFSNIFWHDMKEYFVDINPLIKMNTIRYPPGTIYPQPKDSIKFR